MLETKYGIMLPKESVNEYLDRLIGKVWKLLPMFETDIELFKSNHERLMNELCGAEKMILYCGFYIELINKLEYLPEETRHKNFKKHLNECIDIIQKLKGKVGEWDIGDC